MKKIYVKPMASNVAFVVNENIASSLGIENVTGTTQLDQNGENCNKVFYTTGIATNLPDGVFDFKTAFSKVDDLTMLQIKDILSNPANPQFSAYATCFVG